MSEMPSAVAVFVGRSAVACALLVALAVSVLPDGAAEAVEAGLALLSPAGTLLDSLRLPLSLSFSPPELFRLIAPASSPF